MAQRTGLIALVAMRATVRIGFACACGVPLPIGASATRSTRDRCGLGFSLGGTGPIRSRRLVALFCLGPQTKEPRSVPFGAGNQDRDFREIAVGIPIIDEPVLQHRDAMALALPFSDKDRARLNPARQHYLSARLRSICLHHLVKQALRGTGETAIGPLLNSMRDAAPEQIRTERFWRFSPKHFPVSDT